VKKSAGVKLTIVVAIGVAAHAAPRPEPCSSAGFNEQACQEAIQQQGYCSNGRWVRLKYRYPYPYYYDAYQDYAASGGVANPVVVDACTAPSISGFCGFFAGHSAAHGGFGASGACHSAHS
jgi:hypothetical protein